MKKKKQRILVAEDNPINRKILVRMLEAEYSIVEAVNGKETIQYLQEDAQKYAALLLDIVMPELDGFDVLKFMQKETMMDLPIIVMTGEVNAETEEKALALGAWDFVSKPYNPKVLLTRLKNAIARSRMNYLEEITHFAEHDTLTDLYNRRHFLDVASTLIHQHEKEHSIFVRIDINQFRLINSFLGESGGDRLLIFLADQIRNIAEKYEWYAYGRIESDVFGIVIPYDKLRFDQEVKSLIHQLGSYSNDFLIEPTIGVYEIEDTSCTVAAMYRNATDAAKDCKNRDMVYVGYYDEQMKLRTERENAIVHEMNHALENREFVVYFQPKYNTQTKTPYGAEALVRWQHPTRGMVPPGVFIPVFENNGFVGKLDYYIWDTVCRYLRDWMNQGLEVAPISVNVSRVELSNPKLVSMFIKLVNKYKIPANLLHLEITESAYMDNPELINQTIGQLHEAGFTILMDDFGSGYSSLNTLKDIDVDILKIDMNFLIDNGNQVKCKKILASVITMAQWIGIPVITEGVEREAQYAFLKSIGCEYIQGYYFSKPISYQEYDHLIRTNKPMEAKYSSRRDEEYMIPKDRKMKIYRDELTGAYNRKYLKEWLFLDLDDSVDPISLGLMRLKLRSFDRVIDIGGYEKGNDILRQVAGFLYSEIRKNDLLIRYEENEFILIFVNCTDHVLQRKIDEFRAGICKIADAEGKLFDGASFGYSFQTEFDKQQEVLDEMIKQAGQRMVSHR